MHAPRTTLLGCNAASYAAGSRAPARVDWTARLHEIGCPTLVITGELDPATPPPMGRMIAERIPGAKLHPFDGVSHLSVNEVPEDFGRVVAGFLAG